MRDSICYLLEQGVAIFLFGDHSEFNKMCIRDSHMSNGSMFAHLEKFKSKDFWSEHRMITFNTLTDKQEYEMLCTQAQGSPSSSARQLPLS